MATTEQTQQRWHMVWDIPGAVGTIRDQHDNDIAVVEIQPLDDEGDRAASMMVAAPQLLEALEASDVLLEALAVESGVSHILGPEERNIYASVHTAIRKALAAARGEQQ